ncbi:hypothetical protein EYF80_042356 [Liparis tanakae]|uniref:Uncharacterized protein n=1 Tax=Liparis tanakae TaxID=230148 RepID=A0A4Z2G2H9_9TELE|nr:hypothetical protein EYF80_042356 [Liparis tanakae]
MRDVSIAAHRNVDNAPGEDRQSAEVHEGILTTERRPVPQVESLGDFLFAPLRDAYRQNGMPRLNGSLRLPGPLPAARIDQLLRSASL